jgi:hypothetical protein
MAVGKDARFRLFPHIKKKENLEATGLLTRLATAVDNSVWG